MQIGIVAIVVTATLSIALMTPSFDNVRAQEPTTCQTNALIGYGGIIFGIANICTNGYTINVDLATNYQPPDGKVFEAWLVDDNSVGSGYALSMGKILESGTLSFNEIMVNAKTYTDILVTAEPEDDLSPLTAWSDSVASTWLAPPFGQ
jgi:hypothetical protein